MELSVVVPIYKYTNNSLYYFPEVYSHLKEHYTSFEFIFIIDNPILTEETSKLLDLRIYDNVRVYQLKKNYGQHFATMCGYYFARGEKVVCVDEDIFQYINALDILKDAHDRGVIYFLYNKDELYESAARKYLSKFFKTMIAYALRLKKHSTFRVIDKKAKESLFTDKHLYYNMDMMLLHSKNKISYQDLKNYTAIQRTQTSYNYFKLLSMSISLFKEYHVILYNSILTFIISAFFVLAFKTDIFYALIIALIGLAGLISFQYIRLYITPNTKDKIDQAVKLNDTNG